MSANPAIHGDAQKKEHRRAHAASLRAVLIDNALVDRSMQQSALRCRRDRGRRKKMSQHHRKSPKADEIAAEVRSESPGRHCALTWTQTVLSGLAAAVGIQNAAARERDFASGSPMRFVVVGIVLTALFISALLVVVASLVP